MPVAKKTKKVTKKTKKKVAKSTPTTTASIESHKPTMVRLDALNEAPYNPRYITDDEMKSLKASMKVHGFVSPMIVQKQGMVLISGHQRLRALRELAADGEAVVPASVSAVVLDLPDAMAKQLNITMNRVSGEFDSFKLGQVLSDIYDGADFNQLAIGFKSEEIDELVRLTMEPDSAADSLEADVDSITTFAKSVTLTIPFDSLDDRNEAKALLAELAANGQHGKLVLSLLKQHKALGGKKRRRKKAA